MSSGEELSKLCDSLKSHLGTVTKMRRSKKSVSKLLSNQERMAQYYSRESSSEHSSLEKLRGFFPDFLFEKSSFEDKFKIFFN